MAMGDIIFQQNVQSGPHNYDAVRRQIYLGRWRSDLRDSSAHQV